MTLTIQEDIAAGRIELQFVIAPPRTADSGSQRPGSGGVPAGPSNSSSKVVHHPTGSAAAVAG